MKKKNNQSCHKNNLTDESARHLYYNHLESKLNKNVFILIEE